MERPRVAIRWFPALLLGLFLWGCIFASVHAFADPYTPPVGSTTEPPLEGLGSCPLGELEPFEGEDQAAGETRLLRAELAEACTAIAKRQEEIAHRLWWLVAELLEHQAQTATSNELLTMVKDRLEPPLAVEPIGPVEVEEGSSGEQSEEVVASVDAAGNATKEAVWFLAGLAVALYAAYTLYRLVMPRA